MLPLQGGVLLASIVGCILSRLSTVNTTSSYGSNYTSFSSSSAFSYTDMLSVASTMMVWGLLTLVYASFGVTLFLVCKHFYQSFYRDEGYLAFTLPATAVQHLLSKTISGFTWLLINTVIVALTAFLITYFVYSASYFDDSFMGLLVALYEWLTGGLDTVDLIVILMMLEFIAVCILAVLASLLQVYVSLTIGAVTAKTHKVLAGIGVYIAIGIIIQIVVGISFLLYIFFIMPEFSSSSNPPYGWDVFGAIQFVLLSALVFLTALVVGFFLYTKRLMKNKLNLE